jgi:hypothetical protein
MVLINRAVEVRIESLDFPKGPPRVVRQESHASTEERYEPLPDGGFRIRTTLLEAISSKDNILLPDRVSLTGITIIHRVDKEGHFIEVENVDEVLEAIRARLTTPDVRRLVEPLLTRPYISRPLEAAWRQRFERVCGKPMAPGNVTYAVDDQPVDEIGPIRSIVREVALGQVKTGSRNAMEINLEFGGRDVDFTHSPGALDALLPYAEGLDALSTGVKGSGTRLVDVSNCQIYNDEVNILGEGRLNKRSVETQSMLLPLKVRYEVHRQVLRMTPAEAQALGVSVRSLQPQQPRPPGS